MFCISLKPVQQNLKTVGLVFVVTPQCPTHLWTLVQVSLVQCCGRLQQVITSRLNKRDNLSSTLDSALQGELLWILVQI